MSIALILLSCAWILSQNWKSKFSFNPRERGGCNLAWSFLSNCDTYRLPSSSFIYILYIDSINRVVYLKKTFFSLFKLLTAIIRTWMFLHLHIYSSLIVRKKCFNWDNMLHIWITYEFKNENVFTTILCIFKFLYVYMHIFFLNNKILPS